LRGRLILIKGRRVVRVKVGYAPKIFLVRPLDELHLADASIFDWENEVKLLLECVSALVDEKPADELLGGFVGKFIRHDLLHSLSDALHLRSLGICSFLALSVLLLGEGHSENSKDVVVGGLDVNFGFDQGDPLLEKLAPLILGELQSVEIQPAFHVVHASLGNSKLQVGGGREILEAVWLWLVVQVTTPNRANTVVKSIFDQHPLGRLVCRNPTIMAHLNCRRNLWHLQLEPLLLFEGVGFLLFSSFAFLRKALVFSNSHVVSNSKWSIKNK